MNTETSFENSLPQDYNADIVQIRRITWIGMGVNILLSVIKFILGILGSSQAIVADAFHSLSDLSTDFAILFGVKIWSAPADENHQYGHKRIETLITATIGFSLVIVGVGIGYNSLVNVQAGHAKQPGWIAFIGAIASIIFKEILFHWTLAVGKRANSSAVVANAWHHRTDAISSIPVAVAVAFAAINPKWSLLDPVGAIVVSIFILHSAWRIIKPSLAELSDRSASKTDRDDIESIVLTTDGVISVHAIRTRKMGEGILVDLHVQVDGTLSVQKGHDISKKVKHNLLKNGPNVVDVLVHLEPHEN